MANHSKDQSPSAPHKTELTDMGGPLPRRAVDLLSAKDAAFYVQRDKGHLARLRAECGGPGYLLRGRRVYYEISDLDEWLYVRSLDAMAASPW